MGLFRREAWASLLNRVPLNAIVVGLVLQVTCRVSKHARPKPHWAEVLFEFRSCRKDLKWNPDQCSKHVGSEYEYEFMSFLRVNDIQHDYTGRYLCRVSKPAYMNNYNTSVYVFASGMSHNCITIKGL